MIWVCGEEYALGEYLWGIDNVDVPHEHGEPQTDDGGVEEPCNCTPVWLTTAEFDRRRQAAMDDVMQDL